MKHTHKMEVEKIKHNGCNFAKVTEGTAEGLH